MTTQRDDGTYLHHSDPQGECERLSKEAKGRGIAISANPSLNELRGKLNDMMTYGPSVPMRSKWS